MLIEHLGYDHGHLPFAEAALEIVFPLLGDPDLRVVRAAIWATGRIGKPTVIPRIVGFANHPDDGVRTNLSWALSMLVGSGDPLAVEALLKLAMDPDRDVRDWAVFGLGSQCELDTPEIRAAPQRAVSDPDEEVAGKAITGLALRQQG